VIISFEGNYDQQERCRWPDGNLLCYGAMRKRYRETICHKSPAGVANNLARVEPSEYEQGVIVLIHCDHPAERSTRGRASSDSPQDELRVESLCETLCCTQGDRRSVPMARGSTEHAHATA